MMLNSNLQQCSLPSIGASGALSCSEAQLAKLSTKARKALPKADFAGPGRSYPVQDKRHAANAKARATQMEEEGKLSKSAEKKIDAKANAVLRRGKK